MALESVGLFLYLSMPIERPGRAGPPRRPLCAAANIVKHFKSSVRDVIVSMTATVGSVQFAPARVPMSYI
ncbi:hypothetical protein EVAR_78499_1 [Eumeta japonica]|uniref:Uncharacterized protein n=1 Tax=Eumeta variegata TaxID=151549 RepID=A0A4C1TYF3_EUMVA|nr:hypothetical protein EVAR_78499_1 [Eumeta japonica]